MQRASSCVSGKQQYTQPLRSAAVHSNECTRLTANKRKLFSVGCLLSITWDTNISISHFAAGHSSPVSRAFKCVNHRISAAFVACSFPVALMPEEITGAELRHEQLICANLQPSLDWTRGATAATGTHDSTPIGKLSA